MEASLDGMPNRIMTIIPRVLTSRGWCRHHPGHLVVGLLPDRGRHAPVGGLLDPDPVRAQGVSADGRVRHGRRGLSSGRHRLDEEVEAEARGQSAAARLNTTIFCNNLGE